MSKEYIWSTQLTESKKECLFKVAGIDKNKLSISHTLLLKMIVLGPDAKKGELNVVQFSTTGFGEDKLEGVLCCLQASELSYDKTLIDLTFTSDVTFKLVQGTGPVTLTGQQIFEYDGESDDDEENESMNESDEKMDAELLVNINKNKTKDEVTGRAVKMSKKRAASEEEESSDEENKIEKPKKKGNQTKAKSGKSK